MSLPTSDWQSTTLFTAPATVTSSTSGGTLRRPPNPTITTTSTIVARLSILADFLADRGQHDLRLAAVHIAELAAEIGGAA